MHLNRHFLKGKWYLMYRLRGRYWKEVDYLKIYITVRLWKDQGKWLYKAEHYLKAISIKGRHSIKYNCSTFCLTISHKTTASINVFEFLNCLELSNCKNSSICKKPMISKYKIKWMWDKPLFLPQTIVKWVRKWKDYWNF